MLLIYMHQVIKHLEARAVVENNTYILGIFFLIGEVMEIQKQQNQLKENSVQT